MNAVRALLLFSLALAACLTLREALDMHCKLQCKEDGELGGMWNEKAQACACIYLRYPALKINGVLIKPKKEED